ncbi:MAG: DUF21 domain-containing protein [Alphaproteobacteria bacterium]|nr:DUF21 domain-containing protein [Alphaproteobacteria bacterium]
MSQTFYNLLLAFLLLAANGFYVAAEFALVRSKNFRIDALAEEDKFGARLAQRMMRDMEPYLACCQLGITMASLGLGWIGEPTVAAILEPLLKPLGMPDSAVEFLAFLVGFITFSSLHIVLGEQVPKTLAIRQPEPVSQWIAYPLHASFILFYPLNWLLDTAAHSVLRLLGVKEAAHQDILTHSELQGLVEVSAEHGNLPETQAEYIHNVFKFGHLEVADVMVHRKNVVSVDGGLETRALFDALLAAQHSRIPVWRDDPDNIVGVLYMREVLREFVRRGATLDGFDINALLAQPWFVPDSTTLEEQLAAFREKRAHFALVVDEYGSLQGIVTLEDILTEIIGDLPDENTAVKTGVRKQPDGSFVVDGTIPVRDLNRVYDWNLPEDEATTIAGLVIHEARTIPDKGQRFTFYGFKFEILRRQRNQVTALRITPPVKETPPAPQD